MTPRTETNMIVVHCSATPASMDIGVAQIRRWHLERGFSDTGYHWVIRRNGTMERGRNQKLQGAHCRQVNATSIGICMVGGTNQNGEPEDNFTVEQYSSLKTLIMGLLSEFPDVSEVCGHRDIPGVSKACPSFEVADFLTAICPDEVGP